jgi:hypothetical protein
MNALSFPAIASANSIVREIAFFEVSKRLTVKGGTDNMIIIHYHRTIRNNADMVALVFKFAEPLRHRVLQEHKNHKVSAATVFSV